MNRKEQQGTAKKLKVLNHAEEIGNISKACRYFGTCRETFYKRKTNPKPKNQNNGRWKSMYYCYRSRRSC